MSPTRTLIGALLAASHALHEARVATVVALLGTAGVPAGRVSISDRLAGGTGATSARVVRVLGAEDAANGLSGLLGESAAGAGTLTNP